MINILKYLYYVNFNIYEWGIKWFWINIKFHIRDLCKRNFQSNSKFFFIKKNIIQLKSSFEWHLYWLLFYVLHRSIIHHHGFCEEKFKFLQEAKLFVLIDYSLTIIYYNKLFEAWRVESRIGLIGYRSLIIDYTIVWDNEWFQESLF